MLKQKKGALELSVNTIVIIVIAVTLLTLGLVFVKAIFSNITDITKQTFEQADQEIRNQLSTSNDRFFILGNDIKMKGGTSQTVYAGVKNTEPADIEIVLRSTPDPTTSNPDVSIQTTALPSSIRKGEIVTIPFSVKVEKGAVPGTYFFKITASKINSNYDDDTITVKVE